MTAAVLDVASWRATRREAETLRRQLLATQATAGEMAAQALAELDAGDVDGARLLLRAMVTSGRLAAELAREEG